MNAATPMANQPNPLLRHHRREIRESFLGHRGESDDRTNGLRVVLYSHDTMGIGHMRRNLLIANKIINSIPNSSVLVIAGAKEASIFATMSGVDCLTLPAFEKRANGTYGSRNLGISATEVLDLRSQAILAAITSYKPDLLIADKVPCGAGGELLPSLEWLAQHARCRCVLGLREILDTAETVIGEWEKMHAFEVIRRHFDSIWIYGDRQIYDAVHEYKFSSDIARRVTFTGYLDTRMRLDHLEHPSGPIRQPYVLCTVGGGQDGENLALHFIEAMRNSPLSGVLLTGPYMPASSLARVRANAEKNRALQVIEFAPEGDLLVKHATHVVSMGGYNTLTAILSHKKNALIVPRVAPRKEQLIRARRLAELGYVETVHPQELSPDSIAQWLSRSSVAILPNRAIDMNGLDRIGELIEAEFSSKQSNNKRSEPNADAQLVR
jgi:predicted glycosyltransferase